MWFDYNFMFVLDKATSISFMFNHFNNKKTNNDMIVSRLSKIFSNK